jgi:GTP-binding protein Era
MVGMNTEGVKPYKSGFVAVMGRPNVGKSTLVNAFLGQKIAAVSPRPQTTRRQQLGSLTLERAQVVFVDTPGVHRPRHKLGERMNEDAQEALEGSDLILFLVDASEPPADEDRLLASQIVGQKREDRTILVLNKMDCLAASELPERQVAYQALLPGVQSLAISATRGDNRQVLLETMLERLPEGDAYYPEEQITDLGERDIAANLVREAALIHLRDEIPHGVAVRVDEYTERGDSGAYIAATLFVEREAHKPIVIGQGGLMLKKIGSTARKEIEAMSGRKVFLALRVKVRKGWRDDPQAIKWFVG